MHGSGSGSVRPGFRPDVEGMRAIAVTLVVAYHAGWSAISGGFVGVDVFFVLSGFLITGLLADEVERCGRISFARFYARRARRLLPLASVVLVATGVAFAGVISPLDRSSLVHDIASAALYVSNWHFAAGSLDYLHDPSKSPVLHFWSLSVEEQFYLLWPLLLTLVTLRGGRHASKRSRMVWALGLLAAVSLLLSMRLTPHSAAYSYYGLHTRAWELAAGGLLALGSRRVERLPFAVRGAGAWIGIAMVVVAATTMDAGTVFPGSAAIVPVLGTVLVVAGGSTGARQGLPKLLSSRPLTYVGRISYGWYLWHWPCLVFVRALAGADITGNDAGNADVHVSAWATASAVVVSFALASVSHHLIENPLRHSAWLGAASRRSLAMGAALTTTAVATSFAVLPTTVATASGPVTMYVANSSGGQSASRTVRLVANPLKARDDRPTGDAGCYVGLTTSAARSSCVFGDVHAARTMALVGDSHAEMWFPGLNRFARHRHWRLLTWTKSECPFVDLTVRLSATGDYQACNAWRTSVLETMRQYGRIDVVVTAHSHGYRNIIVGRDGLVPRNQAPAVWRAGWQRMNRSLAGVARHVVSIRDVPAPGIDVPACIAEHRHDIRACSFARGPALRADTLYAAEKATVGAHVSFVDMIDRVCPSDPCAVVSPAGLIMYRDGHHLTASYARALGVLLGRRIVQAIAAA